MLHFVILGLVIINTDKSVHLLCQKIIGTEDIRYIKRFNKVFNLQCDLDLENNKLIFTQNTPA